jgi:hypothetical protein
MANACDCPKTGNRCALAKGRQYFVLIETNPHSIHRGIRIKSVSSIDHLLLHCLFLLQKLSRQLSNARRTYRKVAKHIGETD